MKKNKEFLDFLTSVENPPKQLKEIVEKDIRLSFRTKEIASKFLMLQFLGGLFSMSICPQFGLGLVEGHGITHIFRMIGDWACASFCASVFLSSGALLAFTVMKGEELWWIWRRYTFSLALLPALMWGMLMMGNLTLKLSRESFIYHMIWVFVAIILQVLWMRLRIRLIRGSSLRTS